MFSKCPWCGTSGVDFDESARPADYCGHDPALIQPTEVRMAAVNPVLGWGEAQRLAQMVQETAQPISDDVTIVLCRECAAPARIGHFRKCSLCFTSELDEIIECHNDFMSRQ